MHADVIDLHKPNRRVRWIEPELLLQTLRSGCRVTIVDVRSGTEVRRSTGRIEGARLLPLGQLTARFGELECHRMERIVVVSGQGVRAVTAAHTLASAGFAEVMVLENGMRGWEERGYPVVTPSAGSLPPQVRVESESGARLD